MSHYRYITIVGLAYEAEANAAYNTLLQCVIDSTSPFRTQFLQMLRPPLIMYPIRMAVLTVPPSGGKLGGAIETSWREIVTEWKHRIEEANLFLDWVELQQEEGEEAGINQTRAEWVQEYREGLDAE